MIRVLYPGSFDPITKGHMNIIAQASSLFDEVVIAVCENSSKKKSFFTIDERLEIIRNLYQNNPNIKAVRGKGATIDIVLLYECKAIIRGLRSLNDFDYEKQLQEVNKELSGGKINTICLFADKDYQIISSSLVKEVLSLDKDIGGYVEPLVKARMLTKINSKGE